MLFKDSNRTVLLVYITSFCHQINRSRFFKLASFSLLQIPCDYLWLRLWLKSPLYIYG